MHVVFAASMVMPMGMSRAMDVYPSRPLTLIVPSPKGAAADRLIRELAPSIGRELGQPLRVENRPGMSGILGSARLARAAPDGYTIGYANSVMLSYAEVVHQRLIYRPDDFELIVALFRVPAGVAVPKDSPIEGFDDLLHRARTEPGRIVYTAPGRGASGNVSAQLLARAADLHWQFVPSPDSLQAATLMTTGDADVLVDSVTAILPQLKAGRLRVFATTGAVRSAALPDVPTLTELLGKPVANNGWGGFVAPHGTAGDVVQRLNAAVNRVLADPAMRATLLAMGAEPIGGPPGELRKLVREERKLWSDFSRGQAQ